MKHKKLASLLLFSTLTFSVVGCTNVDNDPNKIIKSINLTSTSGDEESGLTSTYTITFLDGTTYEFTVKNGKDGEPGIEGKPGQDGHTPKIEIGENGNWIIDDKDTGIKATGTDGKDGISIISITKTSTEGLIDTYTITYSDGSTSTFNVVNGKDGEQGIAGTPGKDGHTPEIKIGENGNWIIDNEDTGIKAVGTNGNDGKDGANGEDGLSAYEIYIKYHPEYEGSEEDWINDLINNRLNDDYKEYCTVTLNPNGGTIETPLTFKVKHGSYIGELPTPIKGNRYFMGWYAGTSEYDNPVNSLFVVENDVTLTAKWDSAVITLLDHNNNPIKEVLYYGRQKIENLNIPIENLTYNGYQYFYDFYPYITPQIVPDLTLKPTYAFDLAKTRADFGIVNDEEFTIRVRRYSFDPTELIIEIILDSYSKDTLTFPNEYEGLKIGSLILNYCSFKNLTLPNEMNFLHFNNFENQSLKIKTKILNELGVSFSNTLENLDLSECEFDQNNPSISFNDLNALKTLVFPPYNENNEQKMLTINMNRVAYYDNLDYVNFKDLSNYILEINIINTDGLNINNTEIYNARLTMNSDTLYFDDQGESFILNNCRFYGNLEIYGQYLKQIDLTGTTSIQNLKLTTPNLEVLDLSNITYISLPDVMFTDELTPNLTDIYFGGSEQYRNSLHIDSGNTKLFDGSVNIHFNSIK